MKLFFTSIAFLLSFASINAMAESDRGRIGFDRLDCYHGQYCGTQLFWRTRSEKAVLTVQRTTANGRRMREMLVACGRDDSRYIDWLVKGNYYVFRLYEGRCPSTYPSRHELGRMLDRMQINLSRYDDRNDRRDRRDRRGPRK